MWSNPDSDLPFANQRETSLRLKLVIALLILIATTGCATRSPITPTKLVVKKIGILPVTEPARFALENRSSASLLLPIAAIGFAADSRAKQQVLSEKISIQDKRLGAALSSYLLDTLQASGYEVVLLTGVPRPSNDPENIDFQAINTDADAVLHVYFDEVGLFSEAFSAAYSPRLNIRATLHSVKGDEDIYDETLCYGVDSRPRKNCAIASDPSASYASFEEMVAKTSQISDVFALGTIAIGKRFAAHINATLK